MRITEASDEFKVDGLDWKTTVIYILFSGVIGTIGLFLWNIKEQKLNEYVSKGMCILLFIVCIGLLLETLCKFLFFRFRVNSTNIEIMCLCWNWNANGESVRIRFTKYAGLGSLVKIYFKMGSFEIPIYFGKDAEIFVEAIKTRYKGGISIEKRSMYKGIAKPISSEEIPAELS